MIVYRYAEPERRGLFAAARCKAGACSNDKPGPLPRTGQDLVLHLQRTIGNRAFQNLLAGQAGSTVRSTDMIINRWSREGVEGSLCKTEGKGFVDKLNQLEIYEFTKSVCKYKRYDKNGNIEVLEEESAGEFDPATGEVFIKKDLSDREAASTLYHEITHLKQKEKRSRLKKKQEMTPEQMGKQKQEDEYDAWIREEAYRIRVGLPERQPGFRTRKGKTEVVNEKKVREYVDSLYTRNAPGPPKGYTLIGCWMVPPGGKKIDKPWKCGRTQRK